MKATIYNKYSGLGNQVSRAVVFSSYENEISFKFDPTGDFEDNHRSITVDVDEFRKAIEASIRQPALSFEINIKSDSFNTYSYHHITIRYREDDEVTVIEISDGEGEFHFEKDEILEIINALC